MQLTRNFSLEELIRTNKNVENIPNEAQKEALLHLCVNVLQPIRDEFGAVRITSGYRCEKLNMLVGGSKTSQHVKGEAADFKCENMAEVFEWIKENLEFDQLINEYNFSWIHVSYSNTRNRKQVLKAVKTKRGTIYV